jgi:hypothetical protein
VPLDSAIIDDIVAGVLAQLGGERACAGDGDAVRPQQPGGEPSRVGSPEPRTIELTERVVTAEILESLPGGTQTVIVLPHAIVTPAARDVAGLRGLRIDRAAPTAGAPSAGNSTLRSLLIQVHHTAAVARLWDDLHATWRRELLGCPDDAARLAIAELARGAAETVVILAEPAHRAACLANRHERVKAVAIQDAADVAVVRRQLRANVWCLNPVDKPWFELRRIFQSLDRRS